MTKPIWLIARIASTDGDISINGDIFVNESAIFNEAVSWQCTPPTRASRQKPGCGR